ncbi:hypothetical protein IWQ62_000595 [Dispira parvispora]|uniref:SET domain-containing protein n=1 Tax=Dispira parvispora TaxID=1520584 RepID=A0A9W8E5V7_9FUNG|nr:hypothetical protein IWQ62_000595 [Dispira parvispora]
MPRNYRRKVLAVPDSADESKSAPLQTVAKETLSSIRIQNQCFAGERLSFRDINDDIVRQDSVVSRSALRKATRNPHCPVTLKPPVSPPITDQNAPEYDAPIATSKDPVYITTHPFPISVATFPGKGRGLVSETSIPQGRLIFEETAPTAVVTNAHLGDRCSYCGREKGLQQPLSRCKSCKKLHYCSRSCQLKDWPDHRSECAILASHSQVLPASVRLFHRLLRRPEHFTQACQAIDAMEGILEQLPLSKVSEAGQTVTITRQLLQEISLPSGRDLLHRYIKLTTHSFGWADSSLVAFGLTFLPNISLLNHHCNPNCAVLFEHRRAKLRTLRNISPGEELTISYIDTTLPTSWRQETLQDTYFFKCRCTLCSSPDLEMETLKTLFKCQNPSCSGSLSIPLDISELAELENVVSPNCPQCGNPVLPSTAEAWRAANQTLSQYRAASVTPSQTEARWVLETIQQTVCTTHHLAVEASQLCLAVGLTSPTCKSPDYQWLYHIASTLASTLHQILPGHSPLHSVYDYTVAKLLFLIRPSSLTAADSLFIRDTLRSLSITHGVNSDFYKSLSDSMSHLQLEKRYQAV